MKGKIEHVNSTSLNEKSVKGDIPLKKFRKANNMNTGKEKGAKPSSPNERTINKSIASRVLKTTDKKTLKDEDKE